MAAIGSDLNQMLDVTWVRSQFPALQQQINGHTPAFLNNPTNTKVPNSVITAIQNYLTHDNAYHGGVFSTSRRSDQMITDTRLAMADFFNCSPDEVVFGQNMPTLTF